VAALRGHAKYLVPPSVEQEILELAARYGRVVITRDGVGLRCTCLDELTAERLSRDRDAGQHLTDRIDRTSFRVDPGQRGVLKQALVTAGFPAEDLAGYVAGEALEITFRACAASGEVFVVREYQRLAAESFFLAGSERGAAGWSSFLWCGKRSSGSLPWRWSGRRPSCLPPA